MTNPLFDLTGRTALVTGASQGTGLALAKGLAEAGAKVVLNSRNSEKLNSAAASIGPLARALVFDVTDHQAARAAVDQFENECGPIDILVNNAGIQRRAPLEEFPAEEFERLLRTNISSVFNVGQAVARHMIGRGEGSSISPAFRQRLREEGSRPIPQPRARSAILPRAWPPTGQGTAFNAMRLLLDISKPL